MKKSLISLLVLLATGCAAISHTRYGPASDSALGGYSEESTGATTYRVRFEPNAHTPKEKAEDFTLLRSAELTLERGYRYFVIVSWEKGSSSRRAPIHVLYGTGLPATGGEILTYATSEMVIELKNEPDGVAAHEALKVAQSVRYKYGLRKEPNQSPQPNAGSRPSSDDSPASETPSSLGPRG